MQQTPPRRPPPAWSPGPTSPPAGESGPGPRRFRVTRRRVIIAVCLGLIALLLVVFAGFGYVTYRLGQIRRVAVDGIKPVGPGEPQNILVAGSDSRAGESAAASQHFGSASQVAGQRSDVIIIVHLDPRSGKASMLSIPRDVFVPIAGTTSSNRINTAFDQSPGALVRTISQDFGITINHYAQEDFGGLQAVTDAVGGVCMNFPYPVRDGSPSGTGNESGLNVPIAGKRTLNGAAALSLVRSRYYQYQTGGTWQAEGTGDIGRIQRQHEFMRALASKTLHSSLHNPFTANAVLSRAVHDVSVDSSFTNTGMLRLALKLRSLKPAGIPSWTLPYRAVSNYGGFGDVLLPEPAQDTAVVAAWQSYGAPSSSSTRATTPAVDPATFSIQVLNGSGSPGQAQRAATALRAAGFTVSGYSTAPSSGHASTVVTYASGHEAAARSVAAHLQGPVTVTVQKNLTGATVVVTTGTQFGGVTGAAPTPAGAQGTAAAAPPAAVTTPPWDPRPC